MSYSLDTLLQADSETKSKLAQLERRVPQDTNDPSAYAAYNAAAIELEERIAVLRTQPNRTLFGDLEFLLGS